MTNKDDWYLESSPKPSLRMWIFQQMGMGAIYAALAFFGIIAVILIIAAIGRLLPEDPFGTFEVGRAVVTAIV
jgi:hypothetical protein